MVEEVKSWFHLFYRSTNLAGAANIIEDDIVYVDGGIIREGVIGDQGDGAYSTGASRSFTSWSQDWHYQRGGRANIGSPGMKPSKPADSEIIPETALRSDRHEVFHTGASPTESTPEWYWQDIAWWWGQPSSRIISHGCIGFQGRKGLWDIGKGSQEAWEREETSTTYTWRLGWQAEIQSLRATVRLRCKSEEDDIRDTPLEPKNIRVR